MRRAGIVAFAFFVFAGNFKTIPPFSALPVDLTLLLALLSLAAAAYVCVTSGRIPGRALLVAAFFWLLILPGTIDASSTVYGTEKVQRLFTLSALALIAPLILCTTRRELEWLIWSLSGVAFILVLSGVFDHKTVADYAGAPVTGLASTTIELGRASGLVMIVAVVGLVMRRIRWWVAVPAAALAGLAMLNSGSRGPLLAAIVAIVIGLFFSGRTRRMGAVAAIALMAVVLWVGFVSAPQYARERVVQTATGTDTSSTSRVALFETALRSDRVIAGIGWGGFEAITPVPGNPYPHNIVLEFFIEDGLIPMIALLIWIGVVWWRARHAAVDFAGLIASALLTYMVLNASVSGDVNDNRLFWVAMAMAIVSISLPVIGRQPDRSDEPDAVEGSPGSAVQAQTPVVVQLLP